MNRSIDNTEDLLDVRDIIARYEELTENATEEDGETVIAEKIAEDDREEYETLTALLGELRGNGGDEEWRGVWYPVTLIRESYFETAMDDLLEDIAEMPKNIPPYLKITVDYDALRMDYSEVEYDGVTYLYR